MNKIIQETNFIMDKYNIKANKSLGQNFLINENVVETIVESSNITKEDLVIEIGPGLGTLTKYLLEKAKKVICVELDKKMIEILEDRFKLYDNFELINDDILKVNLKQLISKEKITNNINSVKVVANLPYYITTPIIMKLLEEELDLESITGQKDTGAITYTVYYYANTQEVIEVPNNCFIPEPDVTSEVIKLNIRKEKPVNPKSKEKMFKIIKCAFMQRRKKLLNSLTNANIFKNKEEGINILNELNIKKQLWHTDAAR